MALASATVPRLRIPLRIQIFSLALAVPMFYFFLRSYGHAYVRTVTEETFLWAYAVFCVLNWRFAISCNQWMCDRFSISRKQKIALFGIYLIAVMLLSSLILWLPFPVFYQSVIHHSITILLVPYIISYSGNVKTTSSSRSLIDSVPATAGDLTFRTRRSRAIFVLLGSTIFVIAAFLLRDLSAAARWMAIAFCGLGIPVGILMLWPGSYELILHRDEFIVVILWRRRSYRWDEVCNFAVVKTQAGPRVAWDFRPHTKRKVSKMVTEMYGRNMALIDDYGVAAEELCRIMSARADAAASS